jgi:hypothetical protein
MTPKNKKKVTLPPIFLKKKIVLGVVRAQVVCNLNKL